MDPKGELDGDVTSIEADPWQMEQKSGLDIHRTSFSEFMKENVWHAFLDAFVFIAFF